MDILNLRKVVPQDKEIVLTDLSNNEVKFIVPGKLPTSYILENMAVSEEIRNDPTDPEKIKQAFECIWKVFAIKQPQFSFDDFLGLPLDVNDLASIITFIYNTTTPEEEKKTE